MKRNLIISRISFVLLLIICFVYSFSLSFAYPDEGDCSEYHKIQSIIPYYEQDASIQLDGIPNEQFWTHHSNENENGSLIIPLASEEGGIYQVVIYLNITFVRNDKELYCLCEWSDNSTRPDLSSNIYDGIYFCWNMSVPNFSAYFNNGMATLDMGGGDVDSWNWNCLYTSPPNGSSYFCDDNCFGTYGWYNPSLETQDVKIGYTYKLNRSYTLEMKRNLVTNDDYDVQFDHSENYKFNLGIMNDGTHEDHFISWTYSLNLEFPPSTNMISGYGILILLLINLISIIFVLYEKKHLMNFKNFNSDENGEKKL